MATNKRLKVSELDFNQIKNNLKTFLKTQDTLQDYNFEGSALNTLLDVMAYVTHYNAVNANIGINETFLETAQYRGSVVGHARQLGYTPLSARGAQATVDVYLNSVAGGVTYTLNKNHKFTSVIDGETYTFLTTQSYQSTTGIFSNVNITQGSFRQVSYIFDVNTSEKFIIPDTNVDTSTLTVTVDGVAYTLAKSVINVTGESNVYFLNESFDGRYEITFGDGVIGSVPTDGDDIVIEYLATAGSDANNARAFSTITPINGISNITVVTINSATGGSAKESIASIKYRAPLSYAAQNRAVTPDDYKAIILNSFPNVDSISVWGGQDNDPPAYGKVFISIKPSDAETLSNGQKDFIVNSVLKPKAIASITPEFVDPEYTYVSLEVFYKYDPSKTSLSEPQLSNVVKNSIVSYNQASLQKETGILRYSSLLNAIDNAEESIVNSVARVYMKKRFVPTIGSVTTEYELKFSSPIYTSQTKERVIYKSTLFTYNGEQCSFQDYINLNNERRLRIVRGGGVNQVVIERDIGYIDAPNGKIVIEQGFNPEAFIGSYIELTVLADSSDVVPQRNNLVTIDSNDIFLQGDIDNINVGSTAGIGNYRLVPRHST